MTRADLNPSSDTKDKIDLFPIRKGISANELILRQRLFKWSIVTFLKFRAWAELVQFEVKREPSVERRYYKLIMLWDRENTYRIYVDALRVEGSIILTRNHPESWAKLWEVFFKYDPLTLVAHRDRIEKVLSSTTEYLDGSGGDSLPFPTSDIG